FSGICAAIRLKQELGIISQIYEGSDDLGGTWHANRYPGCACDLPSYLYSLSFEPNFDWSQKYSSAAEIQQYVQRVAKKHNLYSQTRLNTYVDKLTWIDETLQWRLDLRSATTDERWTATHDMIYVGVGSLRIPRIPEIFKGFQGPVVHTANWDSSIDFTNKRVAVIGSGASAVQVVPELQKVAAHLTSYQRTPAWVRSREQYAYSDRFKSIVRTLPLVYHIYRVYLFLLNELLYIIFGYYDYWFVGVIQRLAASQIKQRLVAQNRPDLVEKLTPSYRLGCKRITPSESFLESLCKENVTVETSAIEEVLGRTIRTADGKETEYDILVLATGFDVQGFLGNMTVNGKYGKTLNQMWDIGYPDTYKSVFIHGFPNLFMILGPASLLGHNSVMTMIEIQVEMTLRMLKRMIKDHVIAIEPKKEAQDKFVKKLKANLKDTVWSTGCSSWYLTAQGEISALWSGTVTGFWWTLGRTRYLDDFITYVK
ncbi:FAD-dependent pyridine nucleotide-disulfide oxidoreductase, partial [Dichotomocladium elegans]